MLLAVTILLIGVSSAQISTTMTPPRPTEPFVEQASLGNTQPHTMSHMKPSSTMSFPTPTAETVFTTVLEEASSVVTSAIPIHYTFQPQPTPESTTATSTSKMTTFPRNLVSRSTDTGTRGTMERTARTSMLQFSTASVKSTSELATTKFLQTSSNTRVPKSTVSTNGQTDNDFYTSTESIHPVKPHTSSAYEHPISVTEKNDGKPRIMSTTANETGTRKSTTTSTSVTRETMLNTMSVVPEERTTFEISTTFTNAPTASAQSKKTTRPSTISRTVLSSPASPLTEISTTFTNAPPASAQSKKTTRPSTISRTVLSSPASPLTETSTTFTNAPPASAQSKKTTRPSTISRTVLSSSASPLTEISTTFTNAPPASAQSKKTTRPSTISRTVLSLPASPLTTPSLPSELQKHTDIPPNTVESMHNLPWVKQESTLVFSENDFDNVLHPTLPSALSRRPTIGLKSGLSRGMNKSTTTSVLSSLLKANEKNTDYYKYRTTDRTPRSFETTVPTSPVLNLLTNQSVLRTTTSFRIGDRAIDNPKALPSPTMSQLQLKASGYQSVLHSASFPTRDPAMNNHSTPPSVSQFSLKTSENQSVLHSASFGIGDPATDNPKRSSGVALLPLKTSGNQSVLHSASFRIGNPTTDNPKSSPGVSSFPLKTSGNRPVFRSSSFRIGNPTTDNLKTSSNVSFPLKGSGSQLGPRSSALRIGGPGIDNSKTPPKRPQLSLKTSGNQSISIPAAGSSKLKPKIPTLASSPSLYTNDTSSPEILPTLADIDTVIENVTQNCTNDYCVSDEDYLDMILEYIFPTTYEWVLIGMHFIVYIGGLLGNALVCVAVYRNHSMRTVTNYFIVNLAVADFLVIFLCLPPTVLWDVTETWFMGTALCKIVLYFQTVSVAVSVLTLTFISVDRWYAICCPLKFKSTTARAKTAILVIWVLALAFDIPELIVLQTKRKELSIDTPFFTQCEPSWSDKTDMAFHCLQTLLLYTLPLVFMSIAYCQIVRVLWSSKNIPGHKERLNSSVCNGQAMSCRSNTIDRGKKIDRAISVTCSTTGQVISRRKAAKMLVAVVIMFAVCYFPVHLLSILRYTLDLPQTDGTTAFAMVSHWLCYANSAVNPLIYNFMSGKFRKEFAHTFGCRRISWKRAAAFARRRRRRETVESSGDWRGNGRCAAKRTEMVPLSGGGATNVGIDVEVPC